MNVREKVGFLVGVLAMGVGATDLPSVAAAAARGGDAVHSGVETRAGVNYSGRWKQLELLAQSGRPPAN